VIACAVTTGGVSSKNFVSPLPSPFAVSFVFVSAARNETNANSDKIPNVKRSILVVI
jgi:hypothetical protein